MKYNRRFFNFSRDSEKFDNSRDPELRDSEEQKFNLS